jgi:D-arabinose 1-dehydrogenase-like Zn-dependent alcohol dehydrogenase
MAEEWYPGKNAWEWTKRTAKAHPALTGAVAAGGAAVAIVGTGGLGLVVALSAAAAGSGIAKNIASDKGEKKEEPKPNA